MEYERFILAPPIQNATLRNWPGTNVNGRKPSFDEDTRRNVFTLGVSATILATRSGPRQFAVTGDAEVAVSTDLSGIGPCKRRCRAGRRRVRVGTETPEEGRRAAHLEEVHGDHCKRERNEQPHREEVEQRDADEPA